MMVIANRGARTALALCGLLAVAGPARAAAPDAPTTVVAAGTRYRATGLHRLLFGPHYRRLWATPMRVEILDLGRFAGGLTPKSAGGGKQTKSLKLEGADGRTYKLRSVDKDPRPTLPPELRDTIAEAVVQDQISAGHPAGPIVVDGLAEAAGIPNVPHRFVYLPDDPRLGEFRKDFKDQLYWMEEDISIKEPVTRGFEGYAKLVDWEDMYKLLGESVERNRIDVRAFLKARLFDLFIGDWDRHERQWSWGLKEGGSLWQPVPEDRDQAFAKFDGLLLAAARRSQPRFVDFGKGYPSTIGLVWNGRIQDRRFLGGTGWPVFQEVAAELQRALTDAAIDAAVHRLPPEYYRIDGARMAAKLKARRSSLPRLARSYYELLATEAEIHGSAEAESAEIVRGDDGSVDVQVSGPGGGPPIAHRRFEPRDTEEVRVFLKEGNDRTVSHGVGTDSVKVRVVGGPGADLLDDSQGGRTHFYDQEGENRFVPGKGSKESDKPYESPKDRVGDPVRDWGGQALTIPVLSAGADLGVFFGLDHQRTKYGFRKHPYAMRQDFRLGYSTALTGWKAEYEGDYRFTNSRKRGHLVLRYSEVEVVRFHGFGNETVAPEQGLFYRSPQDEYLVQPSFTFGLDAVDLTVGPFAKFTRTHAPVGGFLDVARPYGTGDFGEAGLNATLTVDRRNVAKAPTRGAYVQVAGDYFPRAWDVLDQFGDVRGQVSTYLGAGGWLRPTLALRAGGKKLWGTFPFHESAFIGGPDTVRGLRRQRYAGDASAFGNAELRLRLGDVKVLVPIDIGVFGLADGGRVWVKGESSDRWHTGVGGGVWFSALKPENTVSFAVARSEGRVRVYFQGGMTF
jgi:hypothetical protein